MIAARAIAEAVVCRSLWDTKQDTRQDSRAPTPRHAVFGIYERLDFAAAA